MLFLTGFGVVGRNHDYIRLTVDRGLVPLLVSPEGFRAEVEAARRHPGHVVHQIRDIAFVRGALDTPESFTADVVAVLRRWEATYEFVGVCAIGEVLVEQAGLVADRYGLRSPGLRASRVCRSKHLQRWYLPRFAPDYTVIPPVERERVPLERLDYPVVVKPASRHSSSGVAEVANARACRERVLAYPAHETVLVEERVIGPEFSVEALVQAGSVVFISATAKRTTEETDGGFTEIGHTLPYRGEHEKALIEVTRELLAALDFQDGMAHAEWRVRASDGRPVLMEVAARTPGDALLLLYHLATGAAMEAAVLRICLGEPATYPAPTRAARQVYVAHPAGAILQDVTYDGQESPRWVAEDGGQWPRVEATRAGDREARLKGIFVLVRRGTVLPAIENSDDRAVTFIVDGTDDRALDDLEADVVRALGLVCGEAPESS
jgi:hypothetical protein